MSAISFEEWKIGALLIIPTHFATWNAKWALVLGSKKVGTPLIPGKEERHSLKTSLMEQYSFLPGKRHENTQILINRRNKQILFTNYRIKNMERWKCFIKLIIEGVAIDFSTFIHKHDMQRSNFPSYSILAEEHEATWDIFKRIDTKTQIFQKQQ